MERINKIIKKALCIKNYLEKTNQDKGNIDGLIKSLESYRDNVGEIPPEKMYIFSVNNMYGHLLINENNFPVKRNLYNWEHFYYSNDVWNIGVKLVEFTSYISQRLFENLYNKSGKRMNGFYSIPPMVLEEHIADAVFDVQTFKVDNVLLSTELINAGLLPTKTNVKFVCDFE